MSRILPRFFLRTTEMPQAMSHLPAMCTFSTYEGFHGHGGQNGWFIKGKSQSKMDQAIQAIRKLPKTYIPLNPITEEK